MSRECGSDRPHSSQSQFVASPNSVILFVFVPLSSSSCFTAALLFHDGPDCSVALGSSRAEYITFLSRRVRNFAPMAPHISMGAAVQVRVAMSARRWSAKPRRNCFKGTGDGARVLRPRRSRMAQVRWGPPCPANPQHAPVADFRGTKVLRIRGDVRLKRGHLLEPHLYLVRMRGLDPG